MCNCASCEYTDSFSGWIFDAEQDKHVANPECKGFADWPRGEPKGSVTSAKEYRAHQSHCGSGGLPKPWTFKYGEPPKFPAWMNGNGPIEPLAKWIRDKVSGVPLTSKGPVLPGPDARITQACKPAQHLRRRDRPAPPQAEIYNMAEEKEKRKTGRPPMPGKRVIVKLEEKQIERVKALGNGSFTKGLRELLKTA